MPDEESVSDLFLRRNNLERVIRWIVFFVSKHANPDGSFEFKLDNLFFIHKLCMEGLLEPGAVGKFRKKKIIIRNSNHNPPAYEKVPYLVREFIEEMNRTWNKKTLIQIGAFAIWRLNWIHPFANGNGRTARHLCYFLMCMKAGRLFHGNVGNLIPELIQNNQREKYIKGLREADEGNPEVLEDLLSLVLHKQLADFHNSKQ